MKKNLDQKNIYVQLKINTFMSTTKVTPVGTKSLDDS